MTSISTYFDELNIPGQQRTTKFGFSEDKSFPLALKTKVTWSPTLDECILALRDLSKSGELFTQIRKHGGAVLIRGIPIKTADDYSRVAHAFGFDPHEEVGRPPIRTVLAPNVKTANEGPPELPIWPHNEYGWSTINPAWLTFSALKVPKSGGVTPIISSIGLANRLKTQLPEFYERLLKKGVRYLYRYGRENIVSTTGSSVFAAYGQNVKANDDEATIRKKIEDEDGSLSVTHVVPIIRKHTATGLTIWFGNLTSAYGRSRHHGATLPPYRGDDGSYHPPPEYGDGTIIANEDLEMALDIAEKMQVDVQWQVGDVVLLDNYAVMHSRRPWSGDRTVLAALWDQKGRIGDFPEGTRIIDPRGGEKLKPQTP
ncbi:Clavaminate synthase-like protein [Amniculicola lignicola CBS 123094]|uniref:Clavaminate synthase-like protein n=1 Tax=Amniculicola lignicola CBS 123094 TaxID=1392246 RepID=A0A6A5WDA9_9PLEO|nr:Clavaminate synthase-like protein [Amniculicola lignicola CBS 123094]